jgi:hypothetical protein
VLGAADWLCTTRPHDDYDQHLVDIAGNGRYTRYVIAADIEDEEPQRLRG